ncbi:MAG: hypothetical protein HPAVJP_4010 [Candidatus Hepatoplasma vulgare]|nr:MAG: hypothetical protein HPAVJP_4010 [Candidatus Hepatoplasma sp.]
MWIKLVFKKEQNQVNEKILKLEQKYEIFENVIINDIKKDISELKIDFKILISRFDNFEKNFYNNQIRKMFN